MSSKQPIVLYDGFLGELNPGDTISGYVPYTDGTQDLDLGIYSITAANFTGSSSDTNTGDQTIELTGDVTGSGTGSFAATLATIGVSLSGIGTASKAVTVSIDAKGRVTALTSQSIQIAESQVTNLTADLALKYDASNPAGYITSSALTGYVPYTGATADLNLGIYSFIGALTGNASTATTLATPRAINGINFDGSAPITVTAAAGTLTGTALAAGVVTSSLTALGTQIQALSMGGFRITNGGDPISGQDFVTLSAMNNAIAGLLDYRGSYDASTNLFPATGGSGVLGAILKADFWICSVAGILGGVAVTPGDLIIALIDTPGQTAANWDLIAHDLGSYVTSVSGTTNRITSSGGATPIINISATFEALLGKVASPLSQFASTTSAQLLGVISDETGSGLLVFNTSPTFVTPLLGTPTSGILTNCTGLPLTSGVTGTLPVGNGGTGLTSLTAGYIPFGNGTSAFSSTVSLFWSAANSRLDINGTASSPLTACHLHGTTTANGAVNGLMISPAADGSDGLRLYQTVGSSGNNPLGVIEQVWDSLGSILYKDILINPSGGNVGINTTATRQALTIGSNTGLSTATPDTIDLGATYSSSAGANLKLRLYQDGASNVYGIGVSGGQMDFNVPASSGYKWYINSVSALAVLSTNNVAVYGNFIIDTALRGLQIRSAAVVAGTANASLVYNVVLVAGTVTVNNSYVTTSHRGWATRTTSSGVTLGAETVTCGSGTFTITSTSVTDTSTFSVLFILPI